MKLREALITQAPTLELHRAAQIEVAKLDYALVEVYAVVSNLLTEKQL